MRHRHAGFSLVELMLVLTLVSVLISLGIPGFSGFLSRYRLTSTSNDFLSGVTLTRSEAIKRGRRVDMVPVNGNWQNGWIVFVDQNNDQLVSAGEEIVHQHGPMPDRMSVSKATAAPSSCNPANGMPFNHSGRVYIAYVGSGVSRLNSGGFLAGSMLFINGSNQRCLVINSVGRTRIVGS